MREIDPAFLNRPVPEASSPGEYGGTAGRWDHSGWGTAGRWDHSGLGNRRGFQDRRGRGNGSGQSAGFPADFQSSREKEAFGKKEASGKKEVSGDGSRVDGRSDVPKGFRRVGAARPVSTGDPSSLAVGMTIEHDRFGRGRIVALEGEMPNAKAVIDFEFGGSKTLLLKFAKLRQL